MCADVILMLCYARRCVCGTPNGLQLPKNLHPSVQMLPKLGILAMNAPGMSWVRQVSKTMLYNNDVLGQGVIHQSRLIFSPALPIQRRKQALLVAYMLPVFQRATGRSGALGGALFGLWVRHRPSLWDSVFRWTVCNCVAWRG